LKAVASHRTPKKFPESFEMLSLDHQALAMLLTEEAYAPVSIETFAQMNAIAGTNPSVLPVKRPRNVNKLMCVTSWIRRSFFLLLPGASRSGLIKIFRIHEGVRYFHYYR